MNRKKTIIYCLASSIAMCIASLMAYYYKDYIGDWCFKDFVIFVGEKGVRWSVIPVFVISVMTSVNGMLDKKQVVRYSNIYRFYGHVIVEIIKESCLFTVISIFLMLLVRFSVFAKNLDNWNFDNSYALKKYGDMFVDTSVVELCVGMAASVFLISCMLGLLYLIIYRISGSLIIGFIINILIIWMELHVGVTHFFIDRRGILTRAVYIGGIDCFQLYVRPIIIIAILVCIIMRMGYRDFLSKKID